MAFPFPFLDTNYTSMQLVLFVCIPPLLLLLLLSPLRRGRRNPKNLPLPPGPYSLPIIGNLNMIFYLSHRGLAELAKKYGGLFHFVLGSRDMIVVSTPEFARQALKTQDIVFSNRSATIANSYLTYNLADMAFTNPGPFWRQMRKLCVIKLFSRSRAQSWLCVREEVASMIQSVARSVHSPVSIGDHVFNLTKNMIFKAAFGTQSLRDHEEFTSTLQEVSKLSGEFNIADFMPWLNWMDVQGINRRLKVAMGAVDRSIEKIIDGHIANPKEADAEDSDMVDEMLAFLGEGRTLGGEAGKLKLTKDNIKAMIIDMMFGGTETVAAAIEWAMTELMGSPEDLKRAQQELADVVGLDRNVNESDIEKLPFLKCVIKEVLRLHPSIPLLPHETTEDTEVQGYFIPKNSRVLINVWAVGRDQSAWKDADKFQPSRFASGTNVDSIDFRGFNFELLPFGSGRRSCPGLQLGIYAVELAVSQLLHCFNWELPDGMKPSELDMSDVVGLTSPKTVRLVAVPTPRLTCPI